MERSEHFNRTSHGPNGRLPYLDALRGICVILVVAEHHLLGLEHVQKCLYSFSLTPFFLISGFLYAQKNEWDQPFGVIVSRSCRRLLYPFVTFSAVNLLWNLLYFKVLFPSAVPDLYSLPEMLLYTVTTYGYNALWYLPCMFWGTLLFAAVRRHRHHLLIWAGCAILIIIFYIFFDEALSGHGLPSYIYCYVFRSVMAMIFLYAGHLLYRADRRLSKRQENGLLAVCTVISCILFLLYRIMPEQFPIANLAAHRLGNPYVYYLAVLAPSLAIYLFCRRNHRPNRLAAFFGRHSLIVMALHMDVFVKIAWYAVAKLPVTLGETAGSVIVVILELAMAPAAVWIIRRYLPFLLRYPQKTAKT